MSWTCSWLHEVHEAVVNEAFPTRDRGDDTLDADRIPLTRRATQHHSPFVVGELVAAAPVEGATRRQMRGNPSVAYKTSTLATKEVHRVAHNAAVQPKAVAYPTDARLIHCYRNSPPTRYSPYRSARSLFGVFSKMAPRRRGRQTEPEFACGRIEAPHATTFRIRYDCVFTCHGVCLI
jgi:hypothetical protein